MKKLIPLSFICLLLFGVSNLQAQTAEDPWGVTVRTGLTGINGDLGNSLLNFGNGNIAYGVGLSYYLSNGFDVALNLNYANLAKANGPNDPVFAQRGTSFEANAVSLDLLLRWKFVNTFSTNSSRFSPYLAAGLGANAIDFVEGTGQGGVPLTPDDRSSWEFSIPFGVGMNIDLNDDLQLNVQTIYNRSFSEEIDQTTGIDDVDHDDWMTTTVGLTFAFGGPAEDEMSMEARLLQQSLENQEEIIGEVDDVEEKLDRLIGLNEQSLAALQQLQEDLQKSDEEMEGMRAQFVRIINNVQFEFDEAEIIEPAYDELNSLADVLNEYQNLSINIEAYADERGSTEYNNDLAQRRAQAVKDYLVNEGNADPARITTDIYGETQAQMEGDSPTAYAQNRSVRITLSYNGGAM